MQFPVIMLVLNLNLAEFMAFEFMQPRLVAVKLVKLAFH